MDVTTSIVRSLVLHSLCEFQLAHARTIWVTAEGGKFSVADDGRGHAVDKLVDGIPYLDFIYTHLDFPFGGRGDAPVQLQGIGVSLINTLCAELTVDVRKPDKRFHLTYRDGQLTSKDMIPGANSGTGTRVAGTVRADFTQASPPDRESLHGWLRALSAACPGLQLHFNGRHLTGLSPTDP